MPSEKRERMFPLGFVSVDERDAADHWRVAHPKWWQRLNLNPFDRRPPAGGEHASVQWPVAPGAQNTIVGRSQLPVRIRKMMLPPELEGAFAVEQFRVGGRVLSCVDELLALTSGYVYPPTIFARVDEPIEVIVRNVTDKPVTFRAAVFALTGPGRPAIDVLTGELSMLLQPEASENAVLEFDGVIPPGETRDFGGVPCVLFQAGRLELWEGGRRVLVAGLKVNRVEQFVSGPVFLGGSDAAAMEVGIAPPEIEMMVALHNPTNEPLRVHGAFFGHAVGPGEGRT